MPTLLDIHVVYVIIEEYLGWLPCLALRATRASALHPSVLLRMREILRLFPGRMNPPFPSLTFRSQGSALWRVIIEPLRRSETPARIGGYQLPALFGRRLAERRVSVRYDRRREVWYHGPGQLLHGKISHRRFQMPASMRPLRWCRSMETISWRGKRRLFEMSVKVMSC